MSSRGAGSGEETGMTSLSLTWETSGEGDEVYFDSLSLVNLGTSRWGRLGGAVYMNLRSGLEAHDRELQPVVGGDPRGRDHWGKRGERRPVS